MVDDVVELDDDGAAVELVVAVVVAGAMAVSVDVLAVVDAVVDSVVELDVVVVEPQAASAARAPAAAKLRIKRMLSSSRRWDREASALNLSDALAQSDNFESDGQDC